MGKKLSKPEIILLFALGIILGLGGYFTWHLAINTVNRIPEVGVFQLFIDIAPLWAKNVVTVNLTVVIFSVVFFGIMSYLSPTGSHQRISFALWSLAWLFQFWSIIFEHGQVGFYFVYLDAVSSIFILWGSLYQAERLNMVTGITFVIPIMFAAHISSYSYFWPSAYINFFVYLHFAVSLLNENKENAFVPAYFIFTAYSLYAGIQLLFPMLKLIPKGEALSNGMEPHEVVRILGYTIGTLAKGCGLVGLVLIGFARLHSWENEKLSIVKEILKEAQADKRKQ